MLNGNYNIMLILHLLIIIIYENCLFSNSLVRPNRYTRSGLKQRETWEIDYYLLILLYLFIFITYPLCKIKNMCSLKHTLLFLHFFLVVLLILHLVSKINIKSNMLN